MRQKRLRAPESWSSAYYHCISRVVGREFLLGRHEKEYFVRLMRLQERFCLVRVVSFCVLDNHFHLLVEEPSESFEKMNDRDFLGHLQRTRSREEYAQVAQDFERWTKQGHREPIEDLKASYFRRMGNVSFFMKALKQEFTQWYNRRHQRRGTLWESRFKSVLINGLDAEALITVAAYIDLNPVRAGIVEDPKDYRWCSYAEARTGRSLAQIGLKQVVDSLHAMQNRQPVSLHKAADAYWESMAIEAEETRGDESERPQQHGLSRKQVEKVVRNGGKLTRPQVLLTRVRYFTDGVVIGSKQSVDEVFNTERWRFGSHRKTGARILRYVQLPGLHALRDLQINLLG